MISPLLANIYLHWFEVVLYRKIGTDGLRAAGVRYTDDFVILSSERVHGLYGYPRKAFRDINHYVGCRLSIHLERRSQRAYKVPEGKSLYRHLQELQTS